MRVQRRLFALAVFVIALSLGGVVAARIIPAINLLGATPTPIPATDACFTALLRNQFAECCEVIPAAL